jgi:hypothetical protein
MTPPISETSFLSDVTKPRVFYLYIILGFAIGLTIYLLRPESTFALILDGFGLEVFGSNLICPNLINSSEFSLTFLETYYFNLLIVFFPY